MRRSLVPRPTLKISVGDRLELPAEEVLQTLKINQRSDGMFIIEDVIDGSSADKVSNRLMRQGFLTALWGRCPKI